MHSFALKKLESIKGKQDIEMLIEGEVCLFEEFENEIQNNPKYFKELGSIYSTLERLANNQSLPVKKFRDITPKSETVKEYEVKSKHLRIYMIKKEDGKIIVLGGYKNNQKRDFRKFRSIKKRYLKD